MYKSNAEDTNAVRLVLVPAEPPKCEDMVSTDADRRISYSEVERHKSTGVSTLSSAEDAAFSLISSAKDADRSQVEKSNSFDEFKDVLATLAGNAVEKTVEYRQLLGTVLQCVRKRDVTHFDESGLAALQDATGLLRRPKVVGLDVDRVYSLLSSLKMPMILPLQTYDQCRLQELDQMLEALLAQSDEN
jgi:hypothetical protein